MDIADRMQVAPDLVAIAAMCALGVVAANARTVYPKRKDTWRVWTNLWGAVVAPAGSMKSPAAAAVERVLNKLEEKAREEFSQKEIDAKTDVMIADARWRALKSKLEKAAKSNQHDAIDRDELRASVGKEAGEIKNRPQMRRVKASDTTIEALIDRAARGTRRCQPIIIWRDELLSLLSAFERDGHENDRKQLMEGWSVTTVNVDRIGRGSLVAKDFAVSIFGCVTPGAFGTYVREATTDGAGSDGFLQRLQLLVYPDPPSAWQHVDRCPDQIAEQRARAVYERLFALDEDDEHGKPPALHFADDAQEFFNEWYKDLELRLRDTRQGWDEVRRSHFSKYRSLMPAIALLCHLASGEGSKDTPIKFEDARRAARWCTYL
jgi:putative DNA primase/helicase